MERKLENSDQLEKQKMNLETSLIHWRELQRFFANGSAIFVSNELDLLDVAFEFSKDNTAQVDSWLQQGTVGKVSDQQALHWFEQDAEVWAVVVKPWILVQSDTHRKNG